jgi:hypothetical protein
MAVTMKPLRKKYQRVPLMWRDTVDMGLNAEMMLLFVSGESPVFSLLLFRSGALFTKHIESNWPPIIRALEDIWSDYIKEKLGEPMGEDHDQT